jgi:hypothetical protein
MGNASLSVTVADDSHNHTIANVDGLQTALNGKATSAQGSLADSAVQPNDDVSLGEVTADNYIDTVYTLTGNSLNPANGNVQTKTISSNTTLTDSLSTGESMVLILSGGDSNTVTYPTMTWAGGSAPTLTSDDVIVFWKVGSSLYGAYIGSVA